MNDTPESPHVHTQGVSAISLKKSYTWLEKNCTKCTALRWDPMGLCFNSLYIHLCAEQFIYL